MQTIFYPVEHGPQIYATCRVYFVFT